MHRKHSSSINRKVFRLKLKIGRLIVVLMEECSMCRGINQWVRGTCLDDNGTWSLVCLYAITHVVHAQKLSLPKYSF